MSQSVAMMMRKPITFRMAVRNSASACVMDVRSASLQSRVVVEQLLQIAVRRAGRKPVGPRT
jgi:hypothetical protein